MPEKPRQAFGWALWCMNSLILAEELNLLLHVFEVEGVVGLN